MATRFKFTSLLLPTETTFLRNDSLEFILGWQPQVFLFIGKRRVFYSFWHNCESSTCYKKTTPPSILSLVLTGWAKVSSLYLVVFYSQWHLPSTTVGQYAGGAPSVSGFVLQEMPDAVLLLQTLAWFLYFLLHLFIYFFAIDIRSGCIFSSPSQPQSFMCLTLCNGSISTVQYLD